MQSKSHECKVSDYSEKQKEFALVENLDKGRGPFANSGVRSLFAPGFSCENC